MLCTNKFLLKARAILDFIFVVVVVVYGDDDDVPLSQTT